jgi:hypothetical protein
MLLQTSKTDVKQTEMEIGEISIYRGQGDKTAYKKKKENKNTQTEVDRQQTLHRRKLTTLYKNTHVQLSRNRSTVYDVSKSSCKRRNTAGQSSDNGHTEVNSHRCQQLR